MINLHCCITNAIHDNILLGYGIFCNRIEIKNWNFALLQLRFCVANSLLYTYYVTHMWHFYSVSIHKMYDLSCIFLNQTTCNMHRIRCFIFNIRIQRHNLQISILKINVFDMRRFTQDILLGLFNFDSCIRIELPLNYESAATHCMIKIFYRVVHQSILFHFLVDIGMPLCYRVKFERISYKLKEYSTQHQFLRMLKGTLV